MGDLSSKIVSSLSDVRTVKTSGHCGLLLFIRATGNIHKVYVHTPNLPKVFQPIRGQDWDSGPIRGGDNFKKISWGLLFSQGHPNVPVPSCYVRDLSNMASYWVSLQGSLQSNFHKFRSLFLWLTCVFTGSFGVGRSGDFLPHCLFGQAASQHAQSQGQKHLASCNYLKWTGWTVVML